MPITEEYKVNFFKPISGHAKSSKKLIMTLALIWFISVFGFQIILSILNNPVAEKSYSDFQDSWQVILNNQDSSTETKQQFSRSILSVLGKNIVLTDNHKTVLKEALSWSVLNLLPDSAKGLMQRTPDAETVRNAAAVIGLAPEGFDKIMIDLLPSSLVKTEENKLSPESINDLSGIMELYLVHNQNALTELNFLGFPFHYWYTSQFLLILFVVLCLIYALVTDKTNKKFNLAEEG